MGQRMTDSEIAAVLREVTEDEVAFYQESGWVMMKQLVTPDFAAELLRVGQDWSERNGTETGWGRRAQGMARQEEAEPFRSFMFSERMARNATRLVNRKRLKGIDVPLRYRTDILQQKNPGAAGAPYHQDSAEHGSDRVGELQFWMALAEVTPEMAAMRFVNRSHREGPLGSVLNDDQGGHLLDQFPNLTSVLELSAPFHYQPGDCTVHHGHTVHGGPDNTTDKVRWSYLFSYSPGDTRYWNGSAGNWGSQRQLLDESHHPVVYPQERAGD